MTDIIEKRKNVKNIKNVIHQLRCHPSIWEIFEHTFVAYLVFSDMFEHLLFINFKKSEELENQIYVPLCLYELAHQIAHYHWLTNRQNELYSSVASTFNFLDISKKINFRQIKKIHKKILSDMGPFYDIQAKLSELLPKAIDYQKYIYILFSEVIVSLSKEDKSNTPWLITEMQRRVNSRIELITQNKMLLEKKTNDILTLLRDRIMLLSTKTNLGLQWSMIILTIIITLLTFVLVITDDSIKNFFYEVIQEFPSKKP
jgi:hypothetical protein